MLRRKEQGPLVVKTVTKIPSSNATVAQTGMQKKAVVRRKGRKPISLRLASSTMSSDDKKEPIHTKDENTKPHVPSTPKETNKKFFGNTAGLNRTTSLKSTTGMTRTTSNPLKWPSRNQSLAEPLQSRRANSELVQNQADAIPETISWESIEEFSGESGSQNTPTKHVAFTREAIVTDILNKERKRQRNMYMDPLGLLNKLFCSALPFSTDSGQNIPFLSEA